MSGVWNLLWAGRMWISVLAALAGLVLGLITVPELESTDQRESFSEFFATSAQVIATLLIALALEARFAPGDTALAVGAIFYVGVGEAAAVTALSSALPPELYQVLFVIVVSAGLGALVTAVLLAGQAIASDANQELLELEKKLLERLG